MNYSEIMDNLIEKKPGWSEAEYKHYYFTMDAIASRHPKRMKETRPGERNGMLMLKSKVDRISDSELKAHAMNVYRQLEDEVEGKARKLAKKDAEKLMRKVAWDVCMLNEVPDPGDLEALNAGGWKLERGSVAGMDGMIVSQNGERVSFIATPRKRNPGKKQTCTMYTWHDAELYARANDALCANDMELAASHMERIEALSLKNDISEALDRDFISNVREPEPEPEPKPEPSPVCMSDLDMVRAMLEDVKDVYVEQKRKGCCIWAKGNTRPIKDMLKGFGFRWSPKKEAWYWKPKAA